jgi:ribosomal protein L40E
MANDMFGGLLKGLSSFMPQDDPNTRLFTLGNEISELQQQEIQLYASIGKKVFESVRGNPEFCDITEELASVQRRLKMVQGQLKEAQEEKEAMERKADALRCPDCGTENPEGVKFCKECGCKMGIAACSKCGTVNPPQTRFCSECGNKLI